MRLNKLLKFGVSLGLLLLASVGLTSESFGDRAMPPQASAPQVQWAQQRGSVGDIRLLRVVLPGDQHVRVAHQFKPTRQVDVQIVSRNGSVVLVGTRVINVSQGETAHTVLEEITLRVPYYRLSMGWDVKAFERELERLGVKVKPPANAPAPRPAPPVTGGA